MKSENHAKVTCDSFRGGGSHISSQPTRNRGLVDILDACVAAKVRAMGIHGLMKFVKERRALSQERLSNCRVVVDGNTLCIFLYEASRADWKHGGDYDRFAQEVTEVLEAFARCRVDLFVLMDGPDPPEDAKLDTMLRQSEIRRLRTQNLGDPVLPLLALHTFQGLLRDAGIPYVVCHSEADRVLAALADFWECPVLTHDSDLCVFDLKRGVIFFDMVNRFLPTPDKTGQPSLRVSVYHVERFLEVTGLTKSTLPLFATLVGRDDTASKTFHKFHNALPRPDVRGITARHALFIKVLRWIDQADNVWEMEIMKERYGGERWPEIHELIMKSVFYFKDFRSENLAYVLRAFGEVGEEASAPSAHRTKQDESRRWREASPFSSSEVIPAWCRRALWKGDLHPDVLTCLRDKRLILPSQVEDLTLPSINQSSLPIRQALYSMLQCDRIMEYDRCKWNEVPTPRRPYLPMLFEVESCTEADKLGALAAALGVSVDFILTWPEELRLLGAVTVFWVRESKPRVSRHHLDALLVAVCCQYAWRELGIRRKGGRQEPEEISLPHSEQGLSERKIASRKNPSTESEVLYQRNAVHEDETNVGTSEDDDSLAQAIQDELCLDNKESGVCVTSKPEGTSLAHSELETSEQKTLNATGAFTESEVLYQRRAGLPREETNDDNDSHTQARTCLDNEENDICIASDPEPGRGIGSRDKPRTDIRPVDATCKTMPTSELENLVKSLLELSKPQQYKDGRKPDMTVVHGFSQLEACLLHAIVLSSALQWPVSPPRLHLLYNATFMYRFCDRLKSSEHPEKVLQKTLGNTAAMQTVTIMREAIMGQLPREVFQPAEAASAKTPDASPKGSPAKGRGSAKAKKKHGKVRGGMK